MRVLVMRPEGDAQETARALHTRGHAAIVAPLLEIEFIDGPEIALDGVSAVLATSSNGIRALARRSARRDVAVFAVGSRTAETARAEGFADVRDAARDAAALADHVPAWVKASEGALLHVISSDAPGTLAAALAGKGYRVRSEALYRTRYVENLPEAARAALRQGGLDAALFFSPQSARVFAELVKRDRLQQTCGAVTACCISKAAAAALQPLAFQALRIAARPDQASLLTLLDDL